VNLADKRQKSALHTDNVSNEVVYKLSTESAEKEMMLVAVK